MSELPSSDALEKINEDPPITEPVDTNAVIAELQKYATDGEYIREKNRGKGKKQRLRYQGLVGVPALATAASGVIALAHRPVVAASVAFVTAAAGVIVAIVAPDRTASEAHDSYRRWKRYTEDIEGIIRTNSPYPAKIAAGGEQWLAEADSQFRALQLLDDNAAKARGR